MTATVVKGFISSPLQFIALTEYSLNSSNIRPNLMMWALQLLVEFSFY